MSQPFSMTRRVEFGDTDMAGIMHFANFFRFMEIAETEFLRARGASVCWRDTASGERLGFPRVSASCDYQSPAKFEDLLTIAVTVEKVGKKSVTYRFDFSIDGRAVASGRISTVYCRHNPKIGLESLEIPIDLRTRIQG